MPPFTPYVLNRWGFITESRNFFFSSSLSLSTAALPRPLGVAEGGPEAMDDQSGGRRRGLLLPLLSSPSVWARPLWFWLALANMDATSVGPPLLPPPPSPPLLLSPGNDCRMGFPPRPSPARGMGFDSAVARNASFSSSDIRPALTRSIRSWTVSSPSPSPGRAWRIGSSRDRGIPPRSSRPIRFLPPRPPLLDLFFLVEKVSTIVEGTALPELAVTGGLDGAETSEDMFRIGGRAPSASPSSSPLRPFFLSFCFLDLFLLLLPLFRRLFFLPPPSSDETSPESSLPSLRLRKDRRPMDRAVLLLLRLLLRLLLLIMMPVDLPVMAAAAAAGHRPPASC
mmetsp:Transcript_25129/g.54845  ORF Transcript_25129/g.54845 Transcript_25129/m.54845 type:complete len:339 (+) Transcript_25129:1578-2594(+)